MTKFYQNKNNKQTYKATKTASGILLENVVSDEKKTIVESTLHRYYVEIQPVQQTKTVQPVRKPLPPADVIRELTQKRTKKAEVVVEQTSKSEQSRIKYPYYKHYKRNEKPLWNTKEVDGALICCNEQGVEIVKCSLSNTGNCIKIEQIASKAKRYFTNFARAKRHVIYDQDINTTKHIGDKFDKWLKAQQKRLTKGDK